VAPGYPAPPAEKPMSAPVPLLELRNVSKAFSGVEVLHEVSFDLREGEVHCIVGENGAGKSTLIKIISGAYNADSGRIAYFGEEAHHVDPRRVLGRGISTIYQEIDLVPALPKTSVSGRSRVPGAETSTAPPCGVWPSVS